MLRIGLFGVGLDTYWPQFPGLLERLRGYQAAIADRLKTHDIALVDAGHRGQSPPSRVKRPACSAAKRSR